MLFRSKGGSETSWSPSGCVSAPLACFLSEGKHQRSTKGLVNEFREPEGEAGQIGVKFTGNQASVEKEREGDCV